MLSISQAWATAWLTRLMSAGGGLWTSPGWTGLPAQKCDAKTSTLSASGVQSKWSLHRSELLLPLLVFLFFLVCTHDALSGEKCEYPDALGNALTAPPNRASEFRITLGIKDYHSTQVVQRHLVYATVWARLLTNELISQTDDSCSAVIAPALFPDLRVYLIVAQRQTSAVSDASHCEHSLENVARWQPSVDLIFAAGLAEGKRISQRFSNPAGYTTVADNILKTALVRIYAPETLMHALVSVEPSAFFALDVTDFQNWLRLQQSANQFTVSPIVICGPNDDPKGPSVSHSSERLPYSSLAAPEFIKLSTKDTGPISLPTLHHVVIVGDKNDIANVPHSLLAIDEYCNREHVFANQTQATRIRCFEEMAHNIDAWTVLFCDPDDCSSEAAAKAVMKAVAQDQRVITSAEQGTMNDQPRGPYLIDVETANE